MVSSNSCMPMPKRVQRQLFVRLAPDERIAVKRVGNQQANAVGALLIGDANTQSRRLEVQRLVENQLIQYLLRVQRPAELAGWRRCAGCAPTAVWTSRMVIGWPPTSATTSALGAGVVNWPGTRYSSMPTPSIPTTRPSRMRTPSLSLLTQRVPHVTCTSPCRLPDLGPPDARAQVRKYRAARQVTQSKI